MIGSPALIPLAAKYANKLGRIHLAEKLSEMLPRVLEMERERDVEVEHVEDCSTTTQSISHTSVIPSPMPSPVVVAPKLIRPGSGRRNPFKRAGGGGGGSAPNSASNSPNPIKHLTDSIVGLPTSSIDPFAASNSDKSEIGGGDEEKSTGTAAKSPSTRKPFFQWFNERRTELLTEMPDGSNPAELTAFAMKKYKQMNAAETTNSAKRKLDEKENEGGSGIAKLAKFRVDT